MNHKRSFPYSSNWARRLNLLVAIILIVALLLPLVAVAPAQASSQPQHVQPLLVEMAAQQPNQMMSVIVQKTVKNASVEAQVTALGGLVTKDLHIINAFAARLPAKAVLQLAQTDGVRWVSLDAPIKQTQTGSNEVFTTWATSTSDTTSSIADNFGSSPIAQGNMIWFNSSLAASGLTGSSTTIYFYNQTIEFTANDAIFRLPVQDAAVTFSPAATTATTTFDPVANQWVTVVPAKYSGTVFLSGLVFQVPGNLPGNINPVTWQGQFRSDRPGVSVKWQWGAAVYGPTFGTDGNALGVKPVADSSLSQYKNGDRAGTPENFKLLMTSGGCGGGTNYTGICSPSVTVLPTRCFTDAANIVDSPLGPNDTFAYGDRASCLFGAFSNEATPGNKITKVEVVLRAYVPAPLVSNDTPKLSVYVGGSLLKTFSVDYRKLNAFVGAGNAGTVYVDITSGKTWTWGDFDFGLRGLQFGLDQTKFVAEHFTYYDAIGLRVTSGPGTDNTIQFSAAKQSTAPMDVGSLSNAYAQVVRAPEVWNEAPAYLQGQGVTVAVVDSGVLKNKDLDGRIAANVNFNRSSHNSTDLYGHGTFVASIVGGNGKESAGEFIGIAPKTNILNVRISNDDGMSSESDVIAALQWIYSYRLTFNIRVVNLALNATVAQSYHTSPLDAACEILWFNGIVVVVSAGNNGQTSSGVIYPPANDPFVITVGAADDQDTVDLADDSVAAFSAYGTTLDGFAKPDLVAPGRNIIASLPESDKLKMGVAHPGNRLGKRLFRMSGTSVSAPMVSGAVALLLQDEPTLNPDQVKYRLTATANKSWPGYDATQAGAGTLDIYAAIHGTTTDTANTGTPVSTLLTTGPDGVLGPSVSWSSVSWSSVSWSSVSWSSVSWSSVSWSSVSWSSDYWGP